MDETEFKSTYYQVNDRPCPFTKAILTRCVGCSRSQKVLIAEREAVTCLSPAAHERCAALLPLLREKALFALRMTHLADKLPHGKEIKVQCGSLRGLGAVLHGEGAPVTDTQGLIEEALARFGTPDNLPYSEIVKAVVNYQARNRNKE